MPSIYLLIYIIYCETWKHDNFLKYCSYVYLFKPWKLFFFVGVNIQYVYNSVQWVILNVILFYFILYIVWSNIKVFFMDRSCAKLRPSKVFSLFFFMQNYYFSPNHISILEWLLKDPCDTEDWSNDWLKLIENNYFKLQYYFTILLFLYFCSNNATLVEHKRLKKKCR